MKEFLRSFVASVFAIVFVFIAGLMFLGIIGGIAGMGKKDKIEKGSYLVLDIYGEILPYNPPDDIVAKLLGNTPETVYRILSNLEKAAVDDRIAGVIVKVSSANSLGAASMQEIRNAIGRVRDADKPVYAWADALDRTSLFLASACGPVYVTPTTDVSFVGMGMTTMYVKGLLDKLDIRPNIHKIADYKSAAEMVLREDMSPESREMHQWIMDDLWDIGMKALSEERGLTEDQLIDCMDQGVFTAEQAKEAGLVDDLMYWDEFVDMVKGEDEELKTVSMSKYAGVKRKDVGLKGKKKIAIVHAHGNIGGRHSRVDPMLGMMMGHETVRRDLERVRKDDDIAAVIFRIDSPGGESLTSDLIGHEVGVVAEDKPVVASMLDVGASGGYSIAYRATKIVADPMTITGSIGSISGKMNVVGMYKKIGITYDWIGKGPNAFFWSPFQDFTEEQWEKFVQNHWDGFNIWLEDVSEHRNIPMDELKKLAMGRVWTGRQAVDNHLIDEVGDLQRAIEMAKELADIDPDEEVELVNYPEEKDLFEMLTSGGAFSAVVRWVTYRFIRDDVARSIEMLVNGDVSGARLGQSYPR